MATVAHTIYSHYDPHDQNREISATADSWEYEVSLMPRCRQPYPRFVPAVASYDEWSTGQTSSPPCKTQENPIGSNIAKWYRSLRSNQVPVGAKIDEVLSQKHSEPPAPPKNSPLSRRREKKNKNNWFIMKAIDSEMVFSSPVRPPTLADILTRDPPPLPNQGKFTPPVWLEIGPSNKGFAMLQRSGWNEGEALGPDVVRHPVSLQDLSHDEIISFNKGRAEMHSSDDARELRQVNVIGLTLPDSNGSETNEIDRATPDPEKSLQGFTGSSPGGTALLTPLATVLKLDRLGIGLKAKTVGSYNASQKRVTHNAASLAAHITAAAENHKRRREHGRGRRGYERQRRQEASERKRLLAYFND